MHLPLYAMLLATGFVWPAAPMADKIACYAVMEQQVQAWNQGDLEAFMASYWKSDELTFSSGGQTTRGWQATLDRYRRKYDTRQKMGKLAFSQFEYTSLGPDAALVLGRWSLARGEDSIAGNFSIVFRKLNRRWVIIHDHSSAEPATD